MPVCHRQGFGISRDGPYLFPRSDTGCIGTGIDGATFISNRFPASDNGRIRIIFHCSTFQREMKVPVVFHMPVPSAQVSDSLQRLGTAAGHIPLNRRMQSSLYLLDFGGEIAKVKKRNEASLPLESVGAGMRLFQCGSWCQWRLVTWCQWRLVTWCQRRLAA